MRKYYFCRSIILTENKIWIKKNIFGYLYLGMLYDSNYHSEIKSVGKFYYISIN